MLSSNANIKMNKKAIKYGSEPITVMDNLLVVEIEENSVTFLEHL